MRNNNKKPFELNHYNPKPTPENITVNPPPPSVTLCNKNAYPLPPLVRDVIYEWSLIVIIGPSIALQYL